MTNEKAIFAIRYQIGRQLVLLGIRVMPDSFYKTMIVSALYDLRLKVDAMRKQLEEEGHDYK